MCYLKLTLCAIAIVFMAGAVTPAAEQAPVTAADIQRLQDSVVDVGDDIVRLRARSTTLADDLQNQLNDLRDEVVYLKVKLRKEGAVPRSEYTDVRDRLETIRARARGEALPATGVAKPADPARTAGAKAEPPAGATRASEVPVGTEIDARLRTALSSGSAKVEDRFEATTAVDLVKGDQVLIPAGSVLRGVVTSVTKAGRVERKASISLSFDQITINQTVHPLRATVTQAFEGEGYRGDAVKIGTVAGVGAIIGGILGGVRGALAGILIGAGGTIAATTGQDVELAPGTVLRLRFDSPLTI